MPVSGHGADVSSGKWVRFHGQFTQEQDIYLRELAHKERKSVAKVVREIVDNHKKCQRKT